MSLILGSPHLPHRLRRFVFVAVGFFGFSILLFIAVLFSAASTNLRWLTFGYEISPIAGLFFALCGFSLLVVAKTEVDDWEQQQGASGHVYA